MVTGCKTVNTGRPKSFAARCRSQSAHGAPSRNRRDFDTGRGVTEVTLEVDWEPRLPVFRIDGEPRGEYGAGRLGGGPGLAAQQFGQEMAPAAGKAAVSGSTFTSVVRLPAIARSEGAGRASGQIYTIDSISIRGDFTVTAAAKMLQFRVPDCATPTTLSQEGVTFTALPWKRIGDRWDVPVELTYPASKVEFESFESGAWLSRNRLQLIDAAGKPREPMNEDWREAGPKTTAFYRFPAAQLPADRKGWAMLYETPGPLVEFPVRFTLNDIPLP